MAKGGWVLGEVMGYGLDAAATERWTSAWSQARAKLSHRAFIELNDELLIPMAYAACEPDQQPKLWQGHRLVSFDDSQLHLPQSASVIELFGQTESANQLGRICTVST